MKTHKRPPLRSKPAVATATALRQIISVDAMETPSAEVLACGSEAKRISQDKLSPWPIATL